MNWSLVGSVVVGIPLLMGVTVSYGRLRLDDGEFRIVNDKIVASSRGH